MPECMGNIRRDREVEGSRQKMLEMIHLRHVRGFDSPRRPLRDEMVVRQGPPEGCEEESLGAQLRAI